MAVLCQQLNTEAIAKAAAKNQGCKDRVPMPSRDIVCLLDDWPGARRYVEQEGSTPITERANIRRENIGHAQFFEDNVPRFLAPVWTWYWRTQGLASILKAHIFCDVASSDDEQAALTHALETAFSDLQDILYLLNQYWHKDPIIAAACPNCQTHSEKPSAPPQDLTQPQP